jgi:hypothetical protein
MSQDTSKIEVKTPLSLWLKSAKIGLFAMFLFVLACFGYGWFNAFSFWHAYADAGRNSAIAHAVYYGVFAGPVVFIAVTLVVRYLIKKDN